MIFREFGDTLDKLIDVDIDSRDLLPLMRRTENILDDIELQYGTVVYDGLNKCYEAVLCIKREGEINE